MTETPRTFVALLDLWPSTDDIVSDIGLPIGEPSRRIVRAWRNRDSIPPRWWRALIAGAERRGLPVTYELLASLAEAREQQNAPAA